jgi:hypothetical protein
VIKYEAQIKPMKISSKCHNISKEIDKNLYLNDCLINENQISLPGKLA